MARSDFTIASSGGSDSRIAGTFSGVGANIVRMSQVAASGTFSAIRTAPNQEDGCVSAYFRAGGNYDNASAQLFGRVQAGSFVSGMTGYRAAHTNAVVTVYRANAGVFTLLSSVVVAVGLDKKLRLLLKTIAATTEYQVDFASTHAGAYSTVINGIDLTPVLGAGLWGFGRSGNIGTQLLDIDDLSINDVA